MISGILFKKKKTEEDEEEERKERDQWNHVKIFSGDKNDTFAMYKEKVQDWWTDERSNKGFAVTLFLVLFAIQNW